MAIYVIYLIMPRVWTVPFPQNNYCSFCRHSEQTLIQIHPTVSVTICDISHTTWISWCLPSKFCNSLKQTLNVSLITSSVQISAASCSFPVLWWLDVTRTTGESLNLSYTRERKWYHLTPFYTFLVLVESDLNRWFLWVSQQTRSSFQIEPQFTHYFRR